jgi:protein involved in polysaccharide export with SLBB domain
MVEAISVNTLIGLRFLAATILSLACIAAVAQTPTAEQLTIFKSLPPEIQKQLLDEMLKEQDKDSDKKQDSETTARPKPKPEGIKAEDLNLRIRPKFEGEVVLRAGDYLLVQLAIAEPELGQLPPSQDETVRLQSLSDRAASGNPYRLTRQGALELPGLAPIQLAGLIMDEAAQRLELDTTLIGLDVTMTLLPLDVQGTDALKPFGYDLFREDADRMKPAMNVPVPAEYVVGPGDMLEVQTYGKEAGRYTLEVGRDGKIDFPELGPIAVAGQRFEAVRRLIEQRVRDQLIGVEVSVSMGELRGIQIFVLGDAERPGSYTVSGLSTITNALLESGGVKPIGSLRDVQLKRNGVIVRRLDLYDVLLNGDTSNDVRLLPGDVIFIPPVGRTAGIEGEVRRPAIYEIKGEGSAEDLLYLSGGLVPEADPRLVRLTRIDDGRRRTIVDLDLTAPSDRAARLQTGDVLRVFPIRPTLENAVALEGHVFRPGPSQYRPGLRLSDVIGSADELRPNADLGYVLIRRESGPGRMVEALSADLGAALRAPGSEADPLLQTRDRIIVFDREGGRERVVEPILLDLQRQGTPDAPVQTVSIFGSVRAPGRYPLELGMTIADLVRAGGGLRDAAYEARAELTRESIEGGNLRRTEVIEIDLGVALRGDSSADVHLSPYDYLSIKEVPEWEKQGVVQVQGEVRFPGGYPIRRGETLKSVIDRAGGLTSFAFPEGSVFVREDLKDRERQQLKTLGNRLQADLATLALQSSQVGDASQGAQTLAVGQQLLTQLQTTEPVGRLVIDLPQVIAAQAGDALDVVMRDGDRLLVPKLSQEVTVLGEVQNATSHFYREGIGRDEYVSLSGGLTARADKGRIYVVRANGSVVANESSGWFSRGNADIRPGDTVVVPLEADRIRPLTLWTAVTTIIYNLAVAVAAINSF